MATAMASTAFVPKKCVKKDPALYARMAGDSTQKVAAHLLTLLPPFPPNSVIHDNGCGDGAVTAAVMAATPPPGPGSLIHATDINPSMIKAISQRANANSWPVKTAIMPAESLKFSDESIGTSISNQVLLFTSNQGTDAAKQIFRTLSPGGTAAATTWLEMPYAAPMKAAHAATRDKDVALPFVIPEVWSTPTYLKDVLHKGGFLESKIKMSVSDVYMDLKDIQELATIVWSYLGIPGGGWTENDEWNWDKAIDVFVEVLEKGGNYQKLESGEGRVKFVANIAIATK
jgi:ubiquinone/menaquinone biosynthesis C-methylase UbiE